MVGNTQKGIISLQLSFLISSSKTLFIMREIQLMNLMRIASGVAMEIGSIDLYKKNNIEDS